MWTARTRVIGWENHDTFGISEKCILYWSVGGFVGIIETSIAFSNASQKLNLTSHKGKFHFKIPEQFYIFFSGMRRVFYIFLKFYIFEVLKCLQMKSCDVYGWYRSEGRSGDFFPSESLNGDFFSSWCSALLGYVYSFNIYWSLLDIV